VLQPDVIFVSDARAGIVAPKNLQGAPDLCVEVLSPGTERIDRVRKLELYARFGVPHYWIVDLEARTIEEYLLERDVYRVRSVTALDDGFRPALFPSWSLAIATVLPA
jgi:Uma2 family endonuclease